MGTIVSLLPEVKTVDYGDLQANVSIIKSSANWVISKKNIEVEAGIVYPLITRPSLEKIKADPQKYNRVPNGAMYLVTQITTVETESFAIVMRFRNDEEHTGFVDNEEYALRIDSETGQTVFASFKVVAEIKVEDEDVDADTDSDVVDATDANATFTLDEDESTVLAELIPSDESLAEASNVTAPVVPDAITENQQEVEPEDDLGLSDDQDLNNVSEDDLLLEDEADFSDELSEVQDEGDAALSGLADALSNSAEEEIADADVNEVAADAEPELESESELDQAEEIDFDDVSDEVSEINQPTTQLPINDVEELDDLAEVDEAHLPQRDYTNPEQFTPYLELAEGGQRAICEAIALAVCTNEIRFINGGVGYDENNQRRGLFVEVFINGTRFTVYENGDVTGDAEHAVAVKMLCGAMRAHKLHQENIAGSRNMIRSLTEQLAQQHDKLNVTTSKLEELVEENAELLGVVAEQRKNPDITSANALAVVINSAISSFLESVESKKQAIANDVSDADTSVENLKEVLLRAEQNAAVMKQNAGTQVTQLGK